MNREPHVCFCVGPKPGHKLCSCMERAREIDYQDMRKVRKEDDFLDKFLERKGYHKNKFWSKI